MKITIIEYLARTAADLLFWITVIGFSGFCLSQVLKNLLDFLLKEEEEK